jgi:predicted RNA binding protein YcfA (HicA-like mRNA interferase family)
MNKRPALIGEARAIVQEARQTGSHKRFRQEYSRIGSGFWYGRNSSIYDCDGKVVAVATNRSFLIVGSVDFHSTEFVGKEMRRQIWDEAGYITEDLPFWEMRLRVCMVKRNGHDVWRVYAVRRRNGKEEIMK